MENVESGKVLVTDKEAESEENIEVEKVLMTTKEELAWFRPAQSYLDIAHFIAYAVLNIVFLP